MCPFLFTKEKKKFHDKTGFKTQHPKGDVEKNVQARDKAQPDSFAKSESEESQPVQIKEKPKENNKFKFHIKEEKSSEKEVYSMIGKGIKIKGELIGEEDITIEGFVEGKVKLDKSLKVGEAGIVIADIEAKMVTVSGKVEGNIYATDKIELLPSANVQGNLYSTKIVISEGANFQGKIDMSGGSKPEFVKEKPVSLPKENLKAKD